MSDIREVINPSDKITVNCDDLEAAQYAVLFVGKGWYGIDGDGLPLLPFGGLEEWCQEAHGQTFADWQKTISWERIEAALASFANVGDVSSVNDIVEHAHHLAMRIREVNTAPIKS